MRLQNFYPKSEYLIVGSFGPFDPRDPRPRALKAEACHRGLTSWHRVPFKGFLKGIDSRVS